MEQVSRPRTWVKRPPPPGLVASKLSPQGLRVGRLDKREADSHIKRHRARNPRGPEADGEDGEFQASLGYLVSARPATVR